MEILEGSYGGRYGIDGMDTVDTLYANTRNNPIEDIESHFPLRVTRYELREDGAGAGRWRGGIGSVREFVYLDRRRLLGRGRRQPRAAARAFGGGPGTPGSVTLNPGTAGAASLPSKIPYQRVRAGEVLRLVAPCGGGYGDPARRDPAAIERDRADGIAAARP